MEVDNDVTVEAEPANGRRDLLTKGAVAAAVAAVAGVAVSTNRASAADGAYSCRSATRRTPAR